jgi:ribosomal 50S subunit-recycling heat shock protein
MLIIIDQRRINIMRLDKYLKNSRIIKRRTVAKDACEQGRVEVNGKVAKPGLELKTGDVIQITFGNNILKVRVVSMPETVRKDDAQDMYEVID